MIAFINSTIKVRRRPLFLHFPPFIPPCFFLMLLSEFLSYFLFHFTSTPLFTKKFPVASSHLYLHHEFSRSSKEICSLKIISGTEVQEIGEEVSPFVSNFTFPSAELEVSLSFFRDPYQWRQMRLHLILCLPSAAGRRHSGSREIPSLPLLCRVMSGL